MLAGVALFGFPGQSIYEGWGLFSEPASVFLMDDGEAELRSCRFSGVAQPVAADRRPAFENLLITGFWKVRIGHCDAQIFDLRMPVC